MDDQWGTAAPHTNRRERSQPAIIYIPADLPTHDVAAAAATCCERVTAAGYHLVGIVRDWDTADAMMRDGRAAITIAADRAHLPADRTPRVELAHDPIRTPTGCTPERPGSPIRRARRLR